MISNHDIFLGQNGRKVHNKASISIKEQSFSLNCFYLSIVRLFIVKYSAVLNQHRIKFTSLQIIYIRVAFRIQSSLPFATKVHGRSLPKFVAVRHNISFGRLFKMQASKRVAGLGTKNYWYCY